MHVDADAVHESVAAVDLAGGLAGRAGADRPDPVGARALVELEAAGRAHLLAAWDQRISSLMDPLEASAPA